MLDFGIRLARIGRKFLLVARLTIALPLHFTIASTISATSWGAFPSARTISGSPFLISRPTSKWAMRATLLMASRLVRFVNPLNPASNLARSSRVAIEKVSDGQFKLQCAVVFLRTWENHCRKIFNENSTQLFRRFD